MKVSYMATTPSDDKQFYEDWACNELAKNWYKNVEFAYCDISDYDLQGITLEDSEFSDCPMSSNMNFEHSELNRVKFTNMDLTNSSFQYMTGDHVTFTNCNVDQVDFSGSKITNLRFVRCYGQCFFDRSHLITAKFHMCDLNGSKFVDSSLGLAEFTKCDLRSTDWKGTDLNWADFTTCNFTDSELCNAKGMLGLKLNTLFTKCIVHPLAAGQNDGFLDRLVGLNSGNGSTKPTVLSSNSDKSYPNLNFIAHFFCSDEVEFEGENQA